MTSAKYNPEGPVPGASLESVLHERSPEILRDLVADAKLPEDVALALLKRRDLSADIVETLTHNSALMKCRRVMLAVVAHPRTPRHISLPLARQLYTFEMMQIALTPTVAADIRMTVEDMLVTRLETISPGERLTLAKNASTRVAAALLCDPENRVVAAALENPRLTEMSIIRALEKRDAPPAFVQSVCRHPKWSLRNEVQVALIRNPHTPAARALTYAHRLPTATLRDLLANADLAVAVKLALIEEVNTRTAPKMKPEKTQINVDRR
jgi:hypothetical protein